MSILFPHHVGHYIGLDVHDTPTIPRTEKLRSGMCVTVEPYVVAYQGLVINFQANEFLASGIYVPDDERWPSHFRGIGVRIEDSICVDTESPLILTTEAVKEV
jgi:intermediate cleaving peptidase 55